MRACAVEATAEDGAGEAGRPGGVERSVGHGGTGVAIVDERVADGSVVRVHAGGHVAQEAIQAVGDVDDQRRPGRGVARVAAEERRAAVEAEVDDSVRVRDCGKGRPIRHLACISAAGSEHAPLVGGDQEGAVRVIGWCV